MKEMCAYLGWDRAGNWLGALGGGIAIALGGWDVPVRILVWCMALDYLTGVIAAIVRKKLSSAIGFRGILRKMVMLVVVAMAGRIDMVTGGEAVRRAVALFYVTNEALSVLENVARAGAPVPQRLLQLLGQLSGERAETLDASKGTEP